MKSISRKARPKTELQRMLAKVDRLASAMKARLRKKYTKDYKGGLDPHMRGVQEDMVYSHAARSLRGKEIPVDIANILMMLWEE